MNKKGVALILALGVLAIVAIIATSFAVNMRLEYHSAANFANSLKAKYAAEAGIAEVINVLKLKVQTSFIDSIVDTTFINAGNTYNWKTIAATPVDPSDTTITYNVDIIDCASQININMGDETALNRLLVNLATLKNLVNPATIANSIANTTTPEIYYYSSKEEIITAMCKSGITLATSKSNFNALKDYIAIAGRVDSRWSNRSPININTVGTSSNANDNTVLKAVLRGLVPGETGPTFTKADAIADQIISGAISDTTKKRPFNNWVEFWDFLNAVRVSGNPLSDTEEQGVWAAVNPYLNLASFPLWVMAGLDSWQITAMPAKNTEFCLTSAGYYDITSTGTVTLSGSTISTYKINTIVKASNLIYETTKDDFEDATAKAFKTTTLNSCPMGSLLTDVWKNKKCHDAVKIGFWEDFDNTAESKFFDSGDGLTGTWVQGDVASRLNLWDSGDDGDFTIGDNDGDGDNELYQTGGTSIHYRTWLVGLGGSLNATGGLENVESTITTLDKSFDWREFTLRAEVQDNKSGMATDITNGVVGTGPRDVVDPLGGNSKAGGAYFEVNVNTYSSPDNHTLPLFDPMHPDWPKCIDPFPDPSVEMDDDHDSPQELPHLPTFVTNLMFFKRDKSHFGLLQWEGIWDRNWKRWCTAPGGDGSHGTDQEWIEGTLYSGSDVWTGNWEPYYNKKCFAITSSATDSGVTGGLWFFINKYNSNSSTWLGWQKFLKDMTTSPYPKSDVNLSGSVGIYAMSAYGYTGGAWHQKGTIDDIRIIPGSPGTNFTAANPPDNAAHSLTLTDFPYFESKKIDMPPADLPSGNNVEWGTINATVSLTNPANSALEYLLFQTSSDDGATWYPNPSFPATEPFTTSGSVIPSNVPSGNSIKYRVLFVNQKDPVHSSYDEASVLSDPLYGDTIALEDVTITYLPKVNVAYYKEAVE